MLNPRLETEAQFLKGVGPKNAAMLAKAGMQNVWDVLNYLPRRYEDRSNLPPIGKLKPGETVTIRGRVIGIDGRQTRGRGMSILKVGVADGTGTISLVWFNQPWVQKRLLGFKGDILAYGTVKEVGFAFEMHAPEFELVDPEDEAEEFARIVPVYALTEGLYQIVVRKAVNSALTYLDAVEETLPGWLLREHRLLDLKSAFREIHRPTSEERHREARRRFVFEEFLSLQLVLVARRNQTHLEAGISFPISTLAPQPQTGRLFTETGEPETLWDEVKRMLPFSLTGAQQRVIGEIWKDMESPFPMNRLVQGDVGSGKTAVAACAMLAAVRCGYQAALMAPTEILAEQHYANFRRLFDPLGIDVELLVGKLTATQKKTASARTREGVAGLAVGTHALIQEGVSFKRLGLVVVDEQHRFGVLQRAALRGKGYGNPDVLVMTATPIPRTLTMAIYGDLDLSVIDELPPGRKPIKTHHRRPDQREATYEVIRGLLKEGRQAYFVCPLVAESEKTMALAAEDLYARLSHEVYPELRVGLLHGQMKAKEKDAVMDQFRKHELDILVSTTVIEVGVDVPNASVMVVEDANRFGLSQLHQLRGRVGRGSTQSFCILIADARTEDAQERMRVMVETSDGFRIAEADLRLRGPGELLGTKQSGTLGLKVADLIADGPVLELARQAAQKLLSDDPTLERPEHASIAEKVKRRRAEEAAILVS